MGNHERIGKAIKNRRKSLGIKAKDIDTTLAKKFDISPFTARPYRENVEIGNIYGTTAQIARKERGQKNMNRLSFYMGELGFHEADYTIVRAKLADKRFKYPLPESETDF